jgi:Domain of unknown function (DUF4332)
MAMKTLEYLRGISAEDCQRLRARGIRHTNQLLHIVALEIDRQRVSAKTGISEGRLLEFGRQCAMLEISGMEPYLPVVRRLGITDLKQLKRSDPSTLHLALVEAVGLMNPPSFSDVQYWISQARSCDTIEDPAEGAPAQLESPSLLGTPVDAQHTEPSPVAPPPAPTAAEPQRT